MEEVIERLHDREDFPGFSSRLEEALSRVQGIEELRDLLAAGSVLLQAGAIDGDLYFPELRRAMDAMDAARSPTLDVLVIGVGEAGGLALGALEAVQGESPVRRIYLDVESSRRIDLDEDVTRLVLETSAEADASGVFRFGEAVRASYRHAAVPGGPPPLIAENIQDGREGRVTVHVVAGLEDPRSALLPDLLQDLKALLQAGGHGRLVLHAATRPAPRVKGSFREAMSDLERSRPFDEAYVLCSSSEVLAHRVAEFIRLTALLPELLVQQPEGPRRGAFASYGVAPAPGPGAGDGAAEYMRRFDDAFRQAAPSWVPSDVLLLELASENVYLVHPPESPPLEEAWKLCPDMVPLALDGAQPRICRIQRGLSLADLRIMA